MVAWDGRPPPTTEGQIVPAVGCTACGQVLVAPRCSRCGEAIELGDVLCVGWPGYTYHVHASCGPGGE